MRPNLKHNKLAIAMAVALVSAVAIAATVLSFSTPVNVSQTITPTEKAKSVRLAYRVGDTFKKAWMYTYGDGEVGRENVYATYSFDEGLTWSDPVLLSKDASGNPTGGQMITTKGAFTIAADNNKPNIAAPPTTAGPNVVVSWTSAYCPENPAAANAGSYTSTVQSQSALVDGGTIDHPFYCVWTATTTDPALTTWTITQLTNGARDAIGDVATANSKGQGFALVWQEDPAGLQPGEAEGPGDGGSGATVSPGTNIWYTHAPNLSNGALLRTNVRQVSDNNLVTTGAPGASRPNLSMSGKTAVIAYEETACVGGSTGKCIVYHSFAYDTDTTTWTAEDAAGTPVSDVSQNARRVRFVLQGAEAAPSSDLRILMLWRESAPSVLSGAPADIVIRRGLVGAGVTVPTTGFTPGDILADTPKKLTDVAATGGNANAHRAFIRNNFIALAYDMTPSMDGSNPEKSNPTTANYNLHLTRSLDSGATWAPARNLSNVTDVAVRVVEPRIVATPGTIINPVTGTADAGDTQNTDTFYISYALEGNDANAAAGKVYVSRTTDKGATFEAFVPVSNAAAGQSEAQLRAAPDGSTVAALWMQEQDNANKDAMFAVATPVTVPDPVVPDTATEGGGGGGCAAAGGNTPFDPLLPVLAVLGLMGVGVRRWRGAPDQI